MAAVEVVAPSAHRPFEIGEPILVYAGAFAASGDGLAGWAAGAAEGRLCVYARAERAPGEVGARARTLAAQGLITLRRTRRSLQPPLFDFQARRTALPLAHARPMPSGAALAPDAQLLLDLLVGLADEKAVCAANDQLAALVGVRDGRRIAVCLTRLTRGNHIAVHGLDRAPWRQIEILETGAMTGVL